MTIDADAGECAALARRFDLLAVGSLWAQAEVVASTSGVAANGRLCAEVDQKCVVTGDAVPALIDQAFALRFVDPAVLAEAAEELELSGDDCDVVAHEDGAIDLGEAVAQTMALALDPFPRSPAADVPPDGVWRAGDDAGPFAILKRLVKD